MNKLEALEKKLDITFKDEAVLKTALVHRSYLNEHKTSGLEHNERLEFLGDAVLELIVTEYLFTHFENPEGELTNWRSSLVNANMLAERAEDLDLYPQLFMSRGESKDQSLKARRYILANAYEALIGAIYIDQGLKVAKSFVLRHLIPQFKKILDEKLYLDSKSKFQEKAQELMKVTPRYKIMDETGPDHNKHFVVGVFLEKELVAKGQGSSKQEAETAAATAGLAAKDWN